MKHTLKCTIEFEYEADTLDYGCVDAETMALLDQDGLLNGDIGVETLTEIAENFTVNIRVR